MQQPAKQQQIAYVLKFIIIGDSGVGKSCALLRFTDSSFKMAHEPTIGVEFGSKVINIRDKAIKLHIWDTAGQQSFRSITRGYYRSAAGAVLVFDITNYDSFKSLVHWLEEVKSMGNANASYILMGNKSDLQIDRKVQFEEAQSFADRNNMIYVETSAKTGFNLEVCFERVAQSIVDKIDQGLINMQSNPPGIKFGHLKIGFRDSTTRGMAKDAKEKCC